MRLVRQRDAFGRPARIADGEGAAQLERRMQRMHELGFVRGGKYPHMRDHAHVGEIEHAVVRGAVLAHDAGTVDGEHHVEIRQGVVDDHLVDGALEERGVQGHDRLHAARRQTAGQAHRMFLGDAGVHETLGELLGERIEARAALHGCRDGHDAIIATSLGGQRLAEHARVRRRGGRLLFHIPRGDFERRDAVELLRVLHRGRVARALARDHVHEHGHVGVQHGCQRLLEPCR